MIRTTVFAALAFATATVTAPAFAGEFPTAEVTYSDLSLSTAQGAQELKSRVARAARQVCEVGGVADAKTHAAASKCARVAVAKAMPQVELALANAQGTQLAENSRVSVSAK